MTLPMVPVPEAEKTKRVYYEPGVILLVIEHGGNEVEEISRQLEQAYTTRQAPILNELLGAGHWQVDVRRSLTFRHLDQNTLSRLELGLPPHQLPDPRASHFSLVRVSVNRLVRQGDLLRAVIALNRAMAPGGRQTGPRGRRGKRWGIDLGGGMTLRSASPNWLTTPSPNVSGGGGPGTIPVPYVPNAPIVLGGGEAGASRSVSPARGLPTTIPTFDFKQLPAETPLGGAPESTRPEVEVAILDTIPAKCDLTRALLIWPNHPLLKPLGDPAVLSCEYQNPYDPLWQLPPTGPDGVKVEGHSYPMSDHGLFVAGIIHGIAPTVKLRLIEVLNELGVGYIDTIAYALRMLRDEWEAQPTGQKKALVINCSLTVVVPLAGQHMTNTATEDELESVEEALFSSIPVTNYPSASPEEKAIRELLDLLIQSLDWVFLSTQQMSVVAVAAAGNDGVVSVNEPDGRREARSPAAFATVVGVGALDDTDNSTAYSNRADRQISQGFATFGGAEALYSGGTDPNYALPGQAVLGVYVGDFYEGNGKRRSVNSNGWAWWSGTSFAAPIVSGHLARLVAEGAATDFHEALTILKNVAVNNGNQDAKLLIKQQIT